MFYDYYISNSVVFQRYIELRKLFSIKPIKIYVIMQRVVEFFIMLAQQRGKFWSKCYRKFLKNFDKSLSGGSSSRRGDTRKRNSESQ